MNKKVLTLLILMSLTCLGVGAEPKTLSIRNHTGGEILKLFLAHHSEADWDEDEDLLEGSVLKADGVMKVNLKKSGETWDMRVEKKGGGSLEWVNVKLNGAQEAILEKNGVITLK